MKPLQVRTIKKVILPEGEPIFSEMATQVYIEDEASGEYLVVKQENGSTEREPHSIIITPEEWPIIRQTIDEMMATLRDDAP